VQRVRKLIESTDVAPTWLESSGFTWPTTLRDGLDRWRDSTPDGQLR
jgi:hypothetical protein